MKILCRCTAENRKVIRFGIPARTEFVFVQTIRNYDKSLLPLAEDAAAYWLQAHIHDTKEKAADWFYTVFSLFDGSFGSDMDFSDEDWEELHAIISAAAESLDMHTVSTIMSVMVERHKLE